MAVVRDGEGLASQVGRKVAQRDEDVLGAAALRGEGVQPLPARKAAALDGQLEGIHKRRWWRGEG